MGESYSPGVEFMKLGYLPKALAGLLVLAGSFAAWVYFASESHFRSFDLPPAFAHPIPNDAASIEKGRHIALTRGCAGCHGENLAGQLNWGVAVAPNLPALARRESAATLEAAIRHGIAYDGRAMYSMPSYNFLRLRDEDLADLIAYLRSEPVIESELPATRLPWSTRLEIATGQDSAMPGFQHLVPMLKGDALGNASLARGEYLAMTTCNECHGFSLRADVPWGGAMNAPDLIIVSAYDEDAFRTLLKTGAALGGRELEMMSSVARARFSNFTDDEVSDLYAFLRDMSARAIADSQ
jgi:mono/diheme cytochrome c family protein